MKDIQEVRESIKEHAKELFGQFGFEKTTLADIASRMGKTKTAIYYHFHDKADIFEDVVRSEFDDVQHRLQEIRNRFSEDPERCFVQYIKQRMSLFGTMAVYKRLIIQNFGKAANEQMMIARRARKDFDGWERDYFMSVGNSALKAKVFPDTVDAKIFANMLSNLLSGLELQFFFTDDRRAMKTTYEALVDLLVFKNPTFGRAVCSQTSTDNR